MAFSDLSTATQNLYMVNFEMGMKLFIIVAFLSFCYWYVKDYKNTDCTFILVKFFRGFLYYASYVPLFLSPLFLFFLYPQYPLQDMLTIVMSIFGSLFAILGVVVLINVPFYGIEFGLEMLGLTRKQDTMHYKLTKKMGINKQ